MFDWKFNEKAEKQFSKLNKPTQKRILAWLNKNIKGSNNPRLFGKSLEGEFQTLWRYRVGKYRIIADIQDNAFVVVIVKTGKRESIYKA